MTAVVTLLRSELRERGLDNRYDIRDDVLMKDLSFAEQMELMATTKVMVAPSGGGSTIGMFLPRGATAVLLRTEDTALDFPLWNNQAHLHARYVVMRKVVWLRHCVDTIIRGLLRFDEWYADDGPSLTTADNAA